MQKSLVKSESRSLRVFVHRGDTRSFKQRFNGWYLKKRYSNSRVFSIEALKRQADRLILRARFCNDLRSKGVELWK